MSSSIIKSHDHTLKIIFTSAPPKEFVSIGNSHLFELTQNGCMYEGGNGLLKLTDYTEEVCIESSLGDFSVGADENNIFIKNVPNNILPESNLAPLRLKIQGHSNIELNNYFDIQLVSKSTSTIDLLNFDYVYTTPEDFTINIPLELCSITLANTEYDTEEYDFTRMYQWSQDNINWSDYKDLNSLKLNNTEYDEDCGGECSDCELYPIDPDEPFYIRVLYTRIGTKNINNIAVKSLTLHGEYEVKIQRVGELASINNSGECIELVQTDIYKVFNLTGYEIDSIPIDLDSIGVTVRFSISQDNCRTWTDWCILTQENLVKHKIDPLRFFHIKYSICLPEGYNYSNVSVNIYDIILSGSVQNVSANYLNGGKMGLRPEITNKSSQQGVTLENGGANYCKMINGDSVSGTALGSNNGDMTISQADPNSLWNPYATNAALDLYNNLSNIASTVFGFNITYFPVNPDENGIDRVVHEYQLMNVDECGDVKVLVPDNQFPDNQIKFTAFNLELFETFEIHVTKDTFKNVFGIERRPRKRDFLFFPELNRMFEVEHAQANKDFLNSSTYYRITLKKYNKKANIKMSGSVETAVDSLTNNTSLDSLFGFDKAQEDKITNKEQYKTLSDDVIRLLIHDDTKIIEENINNASLILSKTHYNLSSIKPAEIAIDYNRTDNSLEKGDNRALQVWFNFTELDHIDINEYVFFNNYDETNSLGYKAWYKDKKIYFKLNNNMYELPVLTIQQDIWYCLMVNLNQCTETLNIHVLKRFTTITNNIESNGNELASSRLDELWTKEFSIQPVEFNSETIKTNISASYIKLTNIRLFNDVIDTKKFTKVLNQYIIKKSNFIIFADNANEKVIIRNHS